MDRTRSANVKENKSYRNLWDVGPSTRREIG